MTDQEKERFIASLTDDHDVLLLTKKFANGDPQNLIKNVDMVQGLSNLLNLVCMYLDQGFSEEYLKAYFKYRLFLVEC